MSVPSKYHEDDRVEVSVGSAINPSKKKIKRTSISYKPVEKETPHGTAVLMQNAVYAKKNNGQLERIDRKKIKGKAAKKEYKRIKMAELRIALEEKACKL